MSRIILSSIVPSVTDMINNQEIVAIDNVVIKDGYEHISGKKYARMIVKKNNSIGYMFCGETQALQTIRTWEFKDKLDNGNIAITKDNNMDNGIDIFGGDASTDNIDNDLPTIRNDVLGDLPNWNDMDLESIIKKTVYCKREAKNGVSKLIPMKDEFGNLIPVKKGQDGSEIGYNKWSGDDMESILLKAMGRDESYLIGWGFDLSKISKVVENLVLAVDVTNAHPFNDSEDVIEYMLQKRAEKYELPIKAFHSWLKKEFGLIKAKEMWKAMKTKIEIEVVSNIKPEGGFEFDSCIKSLNFLTKLGEADDNRWVKFDNAMNVVMDNLKAKHGSNVRLEKSGWITVVKGIQSTFWGTITGALRMEPMSPALEGTIKRFVVSSIRLEMLKVWGEDQHVDRMGEKLLTEGTPKNDKYRMEEMDYVWHSRE